MSSLRAAARDRRLLAIVVLLLALGLSALVRETNHAFRGGDPQRREFPSGWLPGVPRVEALADYLEAVDQRVPMEVFVVVDSGHLSGRDLDYLRMWCAYLLPRHRVVRRGQAPVSARPLYLLTYPALREPPPEADELLPSGVASLHRLGGGER